MIREYSPAELVDIAATFQPKVYFWTQILLCHHTHHTSFKFQFELQNMTRPSYKSEANMSPISMAAPAPWHGTWPMSYCSVFTEICFPYNCLGKIMLLSYHALNFRKIEARLDFQNASTLPEILIYLGKGLDPRYFPCVYPLNVQVMPVETCPQKVCT